jgi:predicted secreted protein
MKKKLLVVLGSSLSFLSLPISVFAQMNDRSLDYSTNRITPTDFAASTFFALYFIIMCVILGAWIAICVWVYKDAKKHNVDSPALWVLLVLFMSFPGLILYILLGRKK